MGFPRPIADTQRVTSVIVPAHNEGQVIGRLLDGLLFDARPAEFEVLVVSNGSADDTADVARRHSGVQVIEIDEASKHLALVTGDRAATSFPRLYVDADVELDTASARALVATLRRPGTLAAAPERRLLLDGSSWSVRAYYRVWERLPTVRDGLCGRGVLGVSEVGFDRIADRPELMGDDLFLHSRFAPDERRIVVNASSVVRGPKALSDLISRRVRAAQGNTQLGKHTHGRTVTTVSTSRDLGQLALREPQLWPSLSVFVAVTIVARGGAYRIRRSGTRSVWLRDESSRR